jgi:hypothetical protein
MTHVRRKALQTGQPLYPISIECQRTHDRNDVSHYSYATLRHHRLGFRVQEANMKSESSTHIIGSLALQNFITIYTRANKHQHYAVFKEVALIRTQKLNEKSSRIPLRIINTQQNPRAH